VTPFDRAARWALATPFAEDARAGVGTAGQKTLPPKHLYDALGSALFEAITQLPEYGLWRAERNLLAGHADDIAARTQAASVVELGSGSAAKTLPVLEALLRRHPVDYCAIDVSPAALAMTRRQLAGMPGLRARGIEDEYEPGLAAALRPRPARTPVLVMLLGSSLGNLDAPASLRLLRRIRGLLRTGDSLLLGADLEKPVQRLLAAYDDALGVTAAFNLNLLVRMNRELGADFMLAHFRHRARFNPRTRNVEMHLESRLRQTVRFADGLEPAAFRAGETIHTECSHKYSPGELCGLLSDSGFRREAQWVDEDWPFASGLFVAD
jgi:L-histidine Nalpha-methyltransferase